MILLRIIFLLGMAFMTYGALLSRGDNDPGPYDKFLIRLSRSFVFFITLILSFIIKNIVIFLITFRISLILLAIIEGATIICELRNYVPSHVNVRKVCFFISLIIVFILTFLLK